MPLGIFRLAGIYGPGRNPLVKLAEGRAHRIVKPGQVFNRIHVDDIAATLGAAVARPATRLYNVADDEPAPPQEVTAFAAGLMGVAPPPEVPFAEADLSPLGAELLRGQPAHRQPAHQERAWRLARLSDVSGRALGAVARGDLAGARIRGAAWISSARLSDDHQNSQIRAFPLADEPGAPGRTPGDGRAQVVEKGRPLDDASAPPVISLDDIQSHTMRLTSMGGSPNASGADRADEPLLVVSGLTKRFGGTEALRAVNFSVRRGEIHALLGANGAGKSTLIKILAGVYQPDGGAVTLAGIALDAPGFRERISFVHQDLGLIETMDVGENMAMGYGFPMRWRFIDWPAVRASAARALDFLGSPLPLNRPVAELSRAEKSIVAIARALVGNVDLLVLDEPTASLPEADVGRLFRILGRLREKRVGVIYVTHRLDEVFRIADAVTVLRDGCSVSVYRPLTISPEQLVTDIVGSVPPPHVAAVKQAHTTPALEVRGLRSGDAGPVSFTVNAGEIVGLAGLRGQGHETVGRAIAGILPRDAGSILIGGKEQQIGNPGDAIVAGLGFATGKRAEEAIAGTMTVKENLFLNPLNFGQKGFSLQGRRREREAAAVILRRFDVRPPEPDRDISTLSGGNQQKVVLARWAGQRYRVLVLEDPTIGVDVGAKAQIYRMMAEDAAAGTAAVVVSSDLDELAQIADRVLAFSRGRVVAELTGEMITVEALTRAVGGVLTPAAEPAMAS